jgi:FkbM family methyltransferase
MIIQRMVKHAKTEGIAATLRRMLDLTSNLARRKLFSTRKKLFLKKYKLFEHLDIDVIRSYYGVKFCSNYQDLTFKFCVMGTYGDIFYKYLRNCPNKYFLIDIGANQGLYSLISAKSQNCIGCVAFEPVSTSFELLEKNIKLNKLQEKIIVHKKAIGSSNGTERIKLISGHSGAASMSSHLSSIGTETELISVINFQTLNKILNIPKNARIIIKIDTEGFEEVIINELIKTKFWRDVFSLFIEVNESWIDSRRLYKNLIKENFTEVLRTGSGNHYDVLMERPYEMH